MNIYRSLKPLKYAITQRPLQQEKPVVIQFPIIDICNSRCQMCNIWKEKSSSVISADELRLGLRNQLYSDVVSVGINGGEPTLREDLAEIIQALFDSLPKLQNISLITNGYKVSQVIDRISQVANVVKKNNGYLDVMLSLDGFEDVHDRVRGHAGYFKKCIEVLDFLQTHQQIDKVRIGCTVIKENVNHLRPLLEFCIQRGVYIKYRLGIEHQRLYNQDTTSRVELNQIETYEFVEFLEGLIEHYERDEHQINFYQSLIEQLSKGSPRQAGCDWQHRGITITSKGELLYCAVKSKVLLKDISCGDSQQAYTGNRQHQLMIYKNDCDGCKHDYVGIPNKNIYRRHLLKKIEHRLKAKKFLQSLPFFNYLNHARHEFQYKKRKKLLTKVTAVQSEKSGVLICGWYGTETLGDKAILAGIVSSLKNTKYQNEKVFLASLHPYVSEITQKQMPELQNVEILSIEEAARKATEVKLTAFGGGPIMGLTELGDMEALFEITKKHGGELLVAGSGVGPLGTKWQNDSIKRILEISDNIIFRDQNSHAIAKEIGATITPHISEDPANTWVSSLNKPDIIHRQGNHQTLILGLRDFPHHQYAQNLNADEAALAIKNFEKSVIDALKILSKNHPYLIIKPLPMCTNHFGSDDRWYYSKLFRDIDNTTINIDTSLLQSELTPNNYLHEINHCDALLGMRFHSLVFSSCLGIPTIAIDYTIGKGKVKALSDTYSLPCFNILELNSKDIIEAVEEALVSPRRDTPQLSFQSILSEVLK